MSTNSFLEMMYEKEPTPVPVQEPKKNDDSGVSELTTAYNFMYDKPKHNNTILQTYLYVLQRPPQGVDPVLAAESHLLSLTEAELKQVMKDLKLQFPESSSAEIDLVKEFKQLDEMAQYKFFCSVRDLFDNEDWKTLIELET